MRALITDRIKRDIGGDRQRVDSTNTRFSKETFKHILVPVWITHYDFAGKTYRPLGQWPPRRRPMASAHYSLPKLIAGTAVMLLAVGVLGFLISAVPWVSR